MSNMRLRLPKIESRNGVTGWGLFKQSLSDYRTNWKVLVSIVAVVSVPVAFVATYIANSTTDTTTAYLAFAQITANAAVIYAVIRLVQGSKVSIREAYYDGSTGLVRLILVTFLIFLMMLPLVLGLNILNAGVVNPGVGVAMSWPEKALLSLLAVVVSIPTFVLVARAFAAIYIVFETKDGPIKAIMASRVLTKGRVVTTLGRMVFLALLLVVMLIIPLVLLTTLENLSHIAVFGMLMQILVALIVLPVSNYYLYRYYLELKA